MDNANELFKIKLTGPGVSVDREVDQKTALAVVAALMGGEKLVSVPELRAPHPVTLKRANDSSRLSLREFLSETDARTSKERITAIGHYLCTFEDQDSFSLDDIRKGYRTAREILPKNLHRDFGNVCKAGWTHPSGVAGKYYVTNTGLAQLESRFGRK